MQPPPAPSLLPPIVPLPLRMETRAGSCPLDELASIWIEDGSPALRDAADRLAVAVAVATGGAPPDIRKVPAKGAGTGTKPAFRLGFDEAARGALGEEGYRLEIAPAGARLSAPAPAGLFYGVQTIRQLLPGPIPCMRIEDRPRFPWRGLLLDCCRHFFPVEFLKRQIDLLAFHKMNRFHWHLTEDQGWRIQIDAFPGLTEVGAWRAVEKLRDPAAPGPEPAMPSAPGERYGGFYTKEEVREVVGYAAERHVTVVPEIEMPGHSVAALAAYPRLSCTGGPFQVATLWGIHEDVYCAGNDETFRFLEAVLDEVLALFPSTFVHIGGDECPKARWKACPKCQKRIRDEGLKDEHELQSWFIKRMVRYLESKGRRAAGWDEILEGGLAPGATVQSWRGMEGAIAAARAGHDVISSPYSHCYVSMQDLKIESCHAFDPVPPELSSEEARHVLGGEACMWAEFADPSNAEGQMYPRLAALAEALWTPPPRSFDGLQRRLGAHMGRLRP